MATPRCPFCNTPGLDRLKIEVVSGQFRVIYCAQCGAIHGILPLGRQPAESPPQPKPAKFFVPAPPPPKAEAPKPAPEQPPTSKPEPPKPTPRPAKKGLDKEQIGAMFHVKGMWQAMAFDAPLCPTCKIEMVEEKVPEGYTEAGQSFWKCPNFNTCKQWLPIRE